MFKNLMQRLSGAPTTDPLSTTDSRLAMAAMLVRVARTDHDYAPAEIDMIDAVLMQRYDLNISDTVALRTEAETLEARAPDTVRFTRLIKDAVPYEERIGVVQDLWRVVLADDKRDFEEDGLMRLVVSLLGVTDMDSALARQAISND